MFGRIQDLAEPYLAKDQVAVDAISRTRRIAILEDGAVIPLGALIDRDGDETDEAELAVIALAALPDGRWIVIDLAAFEPRLVH